MSPNESKVTHKLDETVSHRIQRIEESLKRESWLPASFRSMVASELPELIKLTKIKGKLGRGRLAMQVLALSLASWTYGLSPLDSETISQIRVLDLELSSIESVESITDQK